jgi:hypothetical protein
VKVAAALPDICADLRRDTLADAWTAFRRAWQDEAVRARVHRAMGEELHHPDANNWRRVAVSKV